MARTRLWITDPLDWSYRLNSTSVILHSNTRPYERIVVPLADIYPDGHPPVGSSPTPAVREYVLRLLTRS